MTIREWRGDLPPGDMQGDDALFFVG